MVQDTGWKEFFSDDERYADLINGIGCKGQQMVAKEDLQELDTQTGFFRSLNFMSRLSFGVERRSIKIRDMIRKAAFGVNFAIIGIENQEIIDYSIPLRNLVYDVGEYEKQAAKIRKEIRKNAKGLTSGEYLYGFGKNSRLYPTVTFILYTGIQEWDGPESLHEMLDFTDIPGNLKEIIPDYKINLIEIRKWENTSVFQTDIRQVFDFIRCSEDKDALKSLVENDLYYKNMEEDAFDVAVHYADAADLIETKDYYRKDGKVDMCTGIKEWIADERAEGKAEGIAEGIDEKTRSVVANMIRRGMSDADIRGLAECEQEMIDEVRKNCI